MDLSPKQQAKFWSRFDCSGGSDACWPLRRTMYGKNDRQVGDVSIIVHGIKFNQLRKAIWVVANGPIPMHGIVLRREGCGRNCGNPKHLECRIWAPQAQTVRKKLIRKFSYRNQWKAPLIKATLRMDEDGPSLFESETGEFDPETGCGI